MRRLWRWLVVLAVVLLLGAAVALALPRYAFELLPPHRVVRPAAVFDASLERDIDRALAQATIDSVEDAMNFAFSVSDRLLHFGLKHRTRLSFTEAPREGNCIEYANLYARVFDRAATKGRLAARAYAVHSAKARLFGRAVPMRGWGDHDWVLIQDGNDERHRWYVDPTLHDAGLGWDIAANVRGAVRVPSSSPAVHGE